jgi:PKD repeat protein
LSYRWDFGDRLGESAERDPTYLYTSPGPFTVTLTVTNGLSGDSDTVAHPFAVDEEIDGLTALNDGPTVFGRATTLTATTISGTNVSYSWSLGDGYTDHGATISHRYPTTGTYTATVRAANSVSAYTATTLVSIAGQRYLLPLVLRDR